MINKKNFLIGGGNQVPDQHSTGELQAKIQEIMAKAAMMGSIIFAMITLPAMPLIFYLTILYNVIMMTFQNFTDL
jgi:hypothetical protein